jgi:hypothetical protein
MKCDMELLDRVQNFHIIAAANIAEPPLKWTMAEE